MVAVEVEVYVHSNYDHIYINHGICQIFASELITKSNLNLLVMICITTLLSTILSLKIIDFPSVFKMSLEILICSNGVNTPIFRIKYLYDDELLYNVNNHIQNCFYHQHVPYTRM